MFANDLLFVNSVESVILMVEPIKTDLQISLQSITSKTAENFYIDWIQGHSFKLKTTKLTFKYRLELALICFNLLKTYDENSFMFREILRKIDEGKVQILKANLKNFLLSD